VVAGLVRSPPSPESQDWTCYEFTAPVPASAEQVEVDLTLTSPGRIELRDVTLTRAD
jgi:hypothetical protein